MVVMIAVVVVVVVVVAVGSVAIVVRRFMIDGHEGSPCGRQAIRETRQVRPPSPSRDKRVRVCGRWVVVDEREGVCASCMGLVGRSHGRMALEEESCGGMMCATG